jgi:HK97 gp10 family phage protein
MECTIKLEGFKEMFESLQTLCTPKEVQKICQGAVKKGMKPIRDDAVRRLGKTGRIATRIPRKKTWTSDSVAEYGIGLKPDHWKLIFREYGTKERVTKKGAKRGKIIKHPFIRPALDSQKNAVLEVMGIWLEQCLKNVIENRQKSIETISELND